MTREEEFCEYLKSKNLYEFMLAWREQYERLGKVGGTAFVELTPENQEDIESLMNQTYFYKAPARIGFRSFILLLKNTKYEDVDFNKVLSLYFGSPIMTRKVTKELKKEKEFNFLDMLCVKYKGTKSGAWLIDTLESRNAIGYRIFVEFHKNEERTIQVISWVMEALNCLPLEKNKHESIAVFSSRITSNPHEFDRATFSRVLLNNSIRDIFGEGITIVTANDVFERVGLYEDAVNNYCMLCRVSANNLQEVPHAGWRGFYDSYEIWNMNMRNIKNISSISSSETTHIFVVENPSVFEALCDVAKMKKYMNFGFICTNGQLHGSAHILLNLIAETDIKLYYAGDFDPEGLLIADKLKRRYNEKLTLWCYDLADYSASLSSKKASKTRLSSLEQIETPVLNKIAEAIRTQEIGYQENILHHYLNSMELLSKG